MAIHDFFLLLYCFIIFLSVPFGYRYVSIKTKETGEFLPYLVLSLIFVIADGIFAILIWSLITSSMNIFIYIGGLMTGMIFTSICGFLLLFILILRKNSFLENYDENINS